MYIVSFDVVAVSLAIILLVVHWILFDNKKLINRIYQAYLFSTILEGSLDIYTAKCIEGQIRQSDAFNMWMNSLYLVVTIVSAFLACRLLIHKLNHINKHSEIASNIALAIGIAMLIYNAFTRNLFDFKNGVYIKKPYFLLVDLGSFLLLFLIFLLMYYHRKESKFGEVVLPLFFVIVIIIAFAIQVAFPPILLTALGKAVAGMGYMLYLDSPEHLKLIKAVEQLRESQQEQLKTLESLDEANRQKTEFLVKMSHELKTPINAILGLDEILISESDEKEVVKEAANLGKYGNELLEIVERIVDFSQLETGKLEISQSEYEFAEAYIALNEGLNRMCANCDFTFVNNVSEEIPKRLYGDKKRIAQIMEELVKMSISDFSSGTLEINVVPSNIEDNAVLLEITIDCRGILKKEISRLEEKSLDYVIIEEIAECMSCELEYDEADKSHIRMTIPQVIVDLKPIGNIEKAVAHFKEKHGFNADSNRFTMPKAKILAVDDMGINLDVLEGLLKPYNVSVIKAGSGEEALKYMRLQEFDLVFMDIMMPEMDGVETLHNIREGEFIISKDVVAVALTANTFLGAHDKYISEGFADYITKPVSRQRLAMALREFIPDKIEKDWAELEVTEGYAYTDESDAVSILSTNDKAKEKREETANPTVKNSARPKIPISIREIEGLDYEKALSLCGGEEELLVEILKEYSNNRLSDELVKNYNSENWDDYRIIIHGLKSSSMSVGLTDISEKAKKLEFAARDGDITYIRDNHANWLEEYIRLTDIIRTLV